MNGGVGMNTEISRKKIGTDTVKMTLLSFAMQTAAMAFNVLLTRRAGTAAAGVMSLIFTLFGFIMVLANGNILISTSRFISEARGAVDNEGCSCAYRKVMRYSLTFSVCLSVSFGAVFFLLAPVIGEMIDHPETAAAIRFICLSLPFASVGSCIKGFFHGIRCVEIPMKGDLTEFSVKWLCLFVSLLRYGGEGAFYTVTAASISAGEIVSFLYYLCAYIPRYRGFSRGGVCTAALLTDTPISYLKNSLPILVSGYVQMLLSTANELLVPAALLKFSCSTEAAMASYGMFEAIIMPAVFFPTAVLQSLSGVLVPEAALANRCADKEVRSRRLRELTDSTFRSTLSFSFAAAAVFLFCGDTLGRVLCPADGTVSRALVILAPVIPFIYMEIVLEGLLKGMGRQNFSTVNTLAEYAVRIICVIVFVGRIGFDGVIISYYASNVLSNIARVIVVCREAEMRFDIKRYVIVPMAKGAVCCLIADRVTVLCHAADSGDIVCFIMFILTAAAVYAAISAPKHLTFGEKCGKIKGNVGHERKSVI